MNNLLISNISNISNISSKITLALSTIILLIIIVLIMNYFVGNEGFENSENSENSEYNELKRKFCVNKYQCNQLKALMVYDKEVYPIRTELSEIELDFIYNYIKYSNANEHNEDTHISSYTYSMKISKIDGHVNSSRFAFGTKYNNREIAKNIEELSVKLGIKYIPKDSRDNWGGVGWDLEDKIIKFYTISNDKKTMVCYVYRTTRDEKKNIINTKYLSKKTYDVNKEKTYMFKDGKTVEQYNNVPKVDNIYYKKYPKLKEIISDMNKRGFKLDTYSDYNNFLTLYFD